MATYNDWVTALATLTAIPSDNTEFVAILPSCRVYAENRIYRELDMLVANVRDSSASTVSGSRNFNLPTSNGTFLIIDHINVITPASTAPESGTRTPLQPTSVEVLDYYWPSSTGSTTPIYWAYVTQNTYLSGNSAQSQIVLGPWPDDTYRIEVVGKVQPVAMSASNQNTYLTDNLFDLLVAASMVFMAGYMQNFGSQADNQQMSQSWEAQYKTLFESAATWEARKRFGGASWTSKPIEPMAQPQRG